MRLIDLKPKWMRLNGDAIALIFICPRCVARGTGCKKDGRLTWLTCTFKPIENSIQRQLIAAAIEREPADFAATATEAKDVVGCKYLGWQRSSKLLETISITPSIDAGASGHWHGHIKKGEIVDGLDGGVATGGMILGERRPGRRVYDTDDFKDGDYGRHPFDQHWMGMAPGGHLANLANHSVTEHEDGTITVSPSIEVTGPNLSRWHGYLERGIWRRVP